MFSSGRASWRLSSWFPNLDTVVDVEAPALSLSQALRSAASEEPDADGSQLFGRIRGTVVGLNYYTGVVNKGEMVGLKREPQNPYDRNAVMVTNVNGQQVGHIKRNLAAAMAHIMDNNLAKVEGLVLFGKTNNYNMPVVLSFWGKEESRGAVVDYMRGCGFKLDTSGGVTLSVPLKKYGFPPGGGARPTNERFTTKLNPEQLKNAFDNLFENLVETEVGEKEGAQSLETPLLRHQRQALSWMCAREKSALPPFWEQRDGLYYNSLTCFSTRDKPESVRGGILADDMGLGKTLTTIALILTNFHKGQPLPVGNVAETSTEKSKSRLTERNTGGFQAGASSSASASVYSDSPQATTSSATSRKYSKSKKAVLLDDLDFAAALTGSPFDNIASDKKKKTARTNPQRPSQHTCDEEEEEDSSARTTLIICPLSVLSNWLDQFAHHVRAEVKLNLYVYYGPDRNRCRKFLSSQDVVVTTYNVLAADFANNSPLHEIDWLRVVLDEGHVVRNPNAQMSKAALALKAQRRWVLSGTPLQNSVKDLWMLLAFLRLKPFNVKEWWNRVIQRPFVQGEKEGVLNLQKLVKCITLRRTKLTKVDGRPLVALPEKTVYVERVELSQQEREEYDLVHAEGRSTIRRYVNGGTLLWNYADILVIFMKLRQQCCHPDLLAKTAADLEEGATTQADLRKHLIQKLRLVLSSGSDEECSVCLESLRLPVITHCAHVFCRPCIIQVIGTEKETASCPLCRGDIKIKELVEVPAEEQEEKNSGTPGKWRSSSKVQALMSNLLRLREEDSSIKCLVVSQFTRFLTILEAPLRDHGFTFVRLDGSLSQKKRAQVIQEFQSSVSHSPSIMLLSLKAGGVGLNLTAASHVFLMDPAWNPASEEQCIDRCHRLGQRRNVVVTKFVVKDSVEESMLKIQRLKQDMMEKALGSDKKSYRLDEIKLIMDL
ncbi:helicase-like transcription factor [Synchiropus picturatus]